MIGDDVEVTILDIRGDKVRLGIRAPQRIPVHRKEVYEAIQEENARAVAADTASLNQAMRIYQTRAGAPTLEGMESQRK